MNFLIGLLIVLLAIALLNGSLVLGGLLFIAIGLIGFLASGGAGPQ